MASSRRCVVGGSKTIHKQKHKRIDLCTGQPSVKMQRDEIVVWLSKVVKHRLGV